MNPNQPVSHDGGESVLALTNLFLRHRRALVALPAALAAAAAAVSLLQGGTFVAESRIMARGVESAAPDVAGLAAQFGLTIPASPRGDNILFYAELATSTELLQRLALTRLGADSSPPKATSPELRLVDLYGGGKRSPDERLRAATARLRRAIRTRTDNRSGILTISLAAPQRHLAVQLNRRLLELLNEFNLERRQSQASSERQFVETRLREAETELHVAEDSLRRFLEQNRHYQDSPRLGFEAARLERRVDLRQQVFVSLAQARERARIEEVRNTPVITVIDGPESSVRPAAFIVRRSVIAALLGIVLAALYVVAMARLREARHSRPQDARDFDELRRAITRELRLDKLWRPLRS